MAFQHALGIADVGSRVVVRHRLAGGMATDVLGTLLSCEAAYLVIGRAGGEQVRIAAESVLAAKRVPPGPARVRPAGVADAAGIEALRIACWSTAYRGLVPDAYLNALPAGAADAVDRRVSLFTDPTPGVRQLVAEAAGIVVGWVAAGPNRDDDVAAGAGEIYACYVSPDGSGYGLGGRLLRRALSELATEPASGVTLWVLAANSGARRFYARYGFIPDGASQTLDLRGPVVEVRCVRAGPWAAADVGRGRPTW